MRAENCKLKRELYAKLLFQPPQGQSVTFTAFDSSLSTLFKRHFHSFLKEIAEKLFFIQYN